jgi:hypothetical protein
MFINGLKAMVYMGDGEVRRKNRHRISEDQVVVLVEDPSLVFGEMVQAKETLSLLSVDFGYLSGTTLDSAGIMLEADGKSLAG